MTARFGCCSSHHIGDHVECTLELGLNTIGMPLKPLAGLTWYCVHHGMVSHSAEEHNVVKIMYDAVREKMYTLQHVITGSKDS